MTGIMFVTGGSRGIGRAVVLRFAREGYTVLFTYRSRREKALETVAMAKESGARGVEAFQADVSNYREMERVASIISENYGYLNVLVNNAGILHVGSLAQTTPEEWKNVMSVNLDGVFYTTKAVLHLLEKAEWASIVNIASIAGQTGNIAASAAYAASKAGVIGLTKRLAVELAPKGIRVNAVAPSFVDTDMVADFLKTDEDRKRIRSLHPLNLIIKPEDIAEAVYFLADPSRSKAITGHVLQVNAGRYT
ncbi:MAG: SDR family oxidoreductase [Desulfurococcales archaeon]|nr:SDR family oxidoreductase [Desulfurococcales archaeon]